MEEGGATELDFPGAFHGSLPLARLSNPEEAGASMPADRQAKARRDPRRKAEVARVARRQQGRDRAE